MGLSRYINPDRNYIFLSVLLSAIINSAFLFISKDFSLESVMAVSSEVPVNGIVRRELVDVWRDRANKENRIDVIYTYIVKKLHLDNLMDKSEDTLRKKCVNICKQMRQKWQECHSSLSNFKHKYTHWLEGYFMFENLIQQIPNTSTSSKAVGRPRTNFSESSQVTKRRRIQPLLGVSTEELSFATQVSLRDKGLRTAAAMVKKISESPEEAHQLKKSISQTIKTPIKLSPDQALASFIHKRLTKDQYILIHNETKKQNADIYPIYDDLLLAKKRCYPENIIVTDVSAEVRLQSLLDHTARRLMFVQKDVLVQANPSSVTAIYKWGCDGAAGQRYKQGFTTADEEQIQCDDSFLFGISCVHLRLVGNNYAIIWQNQRPSSTSFCRPIKLLFKNETDQLVLKEIAVIKEQISQLIPTKVSIDDCVCEVTHSLHLTMIDGKICNILTETPSSKCFICKANPKAMNDLQSHSQRSPNTEALTFGFSSLHAWIKCFEAILHIGYKLDIKKWQARHNDKETVQTRRKIIQDRLRREINLLVDIPKPGFGTTNDGNTARRFFANPTLAAEITGVDETLIYRLSIILRTIACGLEIDSKNFGKYAFETAELYVSLYNWYYMPPTMHKLLIHGEEIIKSAIAPIGQMSEEAQEAKHKDIKRFRRDNTRKISREATMEDLMNMCLITSDPVISSLLHRPSKKSGPLPSDVINMLKPSYNEIEVPCDTESDNEF